MERTAASVFGVVVRFNYLIIGQGIAGSLLARNLLKRQQTVLVVDNNHHWSSSSISTGIINPITGKRLALTPQFDLFFQHAMRVYDDLSQEFKQPFFTPKPVIRIFQDQVERDQFLLKTDLKSLIEAIKEAGAWGSHVHDPFGSVIFNSGGYCHASSILNAIRHDFATKALLVNSKLLLNELVINAEGVQWQGHEFDHIIFCEGFQSVGNPWFNDLPFNNAKGEIIHFTLASTALPDAIIVQTKWCAPLQDGVWAAGATYDRDVLNCQATDQAIKDINDGLAKFIIPKGVIIKHMAAVRPVMIDQMPVLGFHPTEHRVGIFNGLGSKGFLMAPFYADMLADHLIGGKELPRTVDVKRFK